MGETTALALESLASPIYFNRLGHLLLSQLFISNRVCYASNVPGKAFARPRGRALAVALLVVRYATWTSLHPSSTTGSCVLCTRRCPSCRVVQSGKSKTEFVRPDTSVSPFPQKSLLIFSVITGTINVGIRNLLSSRGLFQSTKCLERPQRLAASEPSSLLGTRHLHVKWLFVRSDFYQCSFSQHLVVPPTSRLRRRLPWVRRDLGGRTKKPSSHLKSIRQLGSQSSQPHCVIMGAQASSRMTVPPHGYLRRSAPEEKKVNFALILLLLPS